MDTFNDKTLNCADCGQEFVFSKNEQAFYAERGFTNEPKRCKSCRDKRKTARDGNGGGRERTMVSDIRVLNYKEMSGFDVPTEFLVLRNGRPVWREQYADVRINEDFPPGTFDQARWNDIPIPKL